MSQEKAAEEQLWELSKVAEAKAAIMKVELSGQLTKKVLIDMLAQATMEFQKATLLCQEAQRQLKEATSDGAIPKEA